MARRDVNLLANLSATIAIGATPVLALEVTVDNLRNTAGNVVVCVWRGQDKGLPNCATGQPFKTMTAPASAPKVIFSDLPPSQYAVSMFHDEKKLGKPETNMLGIPLSGVGLSNNPTLGPMNLPTFERGRFVIPDTTSIRIAAVYLS